MNDVKNETVLISGVEIPSTSALINLINLSNSNKDKKPSFKEIMVAYSMMGQAQASSSPLVAKDLASGLYDYELALISYRTLKGFLPADMSFIEEKEVLEGVERLRASLKIMEKNLTDRLHKRVDELFSGGNSFSDNRKKMYQCGKTYRETNKPSVLGTVAEISERYDLSKKKVRELKREGKLEEYIKEMENK